MSPHEADNQLDLTLIARIVEGALLASNQPLTLAQLQGLFPNDPPIPRIASSVPLNCYSTPVLNAA